MAAFTNSAARAGDYYLVKVDAGLPLLPSPSTSPSISIESPLQPTVIIVLTVFFVATTVLLLGLYVRRKNKKVKAKTP